MRAILLHLPIGVNTCDSCMLRIRKDEYTPSGVQAKGNAFCTAFGIPLIEVGTNNMRCKECLDAAITE